MAQKLSPIFWHEAKALDFSDKMNKFNKFCFSYPSVNVVHYHTDLAMCQKRLSSDVCKNKMVSVVAALY